MNNQELKLNFYNKYFEAIQKAEEVAKYLFENTELFEKKYTENYPAEEFKFFAGKIGRYARERNKLLEIMDEKEIKLLKQIELINK